MLRLSSKHSVIIPLLALLLLPGVGSMSNSFAQEYDIPDIAIGEMDIPTQEEIEKMMQQQEVSGKYTNSEHGVEVTIPNGWSGMSMDFKDPTTGEWISGFQVMEGGFEANMDSMQNGEFEIIMLSIMDKPEEETTEPPDVQPPTDEFDVDCELVEMEKTSVNGKDAMMVEAQCEGDISMKSKMYHYATNEKIISYAYMTSSSSGFDNNINNFDDSVKTIKIENQVNVSYEIPEDWAVRDAISDTREEVVETITDTAEATEEALSETAEATEEALSETAEATEEALSETAEATGEAMEDAGEAMEEAAETTGEAMEEAAETTGEAMEEAAETTGEMAKDAVEATGEAMEDAGEAMQEAVADDTEGGGCLIATAAYGTELAPQVQFLREIRDNTVMSTSSGATFMTGFNQLYYSFSPTIADMERENPIFQESVRLFITPMLSSLSIMTLAEDGNEAQVLGLGISVIALNLGLYLAVPAVIGFTISKRFKSKNL